MQDKGAQRGIYAHVMGISNPSQNTSKVEPERSERPSARNSTALVTILSTLILGLAIALAHHFMNSHLDGKTVDSLSLSQAWISRFGTALAFLAKTAFVISIAASFVQYQWFKLRRHSLSVDEVNTLTSVLGNIFGLFRPALWFRNPLLASMATLAWTIPLAAIVTPGSLSVRPRLLSNTTSLYVPEPLYTRYHSYYYYAVDGYGERASHNGDGYVSPDGVDSDPVFITSSNLIHKLAFGAAASSQPVSLPSANQNQTYHLDFDGPAVKCSPANESIMYNVTVDQGLNYGSTRRNTFLSWVGSGLNSTLATQPSPQTLDYYSLDAARIWVMTNIDYWNESVHTPFPDSPPPMYQNDTYWRDYYTFMKVNVTECQLYNASYSVDFQFQYPNQTRQVSISKWLHPITAINFWDPVSEVVDVLPHLALMNAFGKVLLVGSYTESEYAFKLSYSSWNIINIDWTRAKAIPSGLEQLFQNITLSALSDASLIKNSTTGAQPVPVTAVTYPISYHYDPFDLPLPYGLSLLFTLICAGIGLRAFFLNDHASFQNLFSTYLRATSGLDIKGLVPVGDTGADPLSKSIAKARIVVGEERGS